jgi:hypothetical protein
MPLRERVQAGVDTFDELRIEFARQGNGDQRRRRRSCHRRDVAQASSESFVTDAPGLHFAGEVDPFDHGVRLEQDELVWHPEVEHGAIVTRANDDGVIGRQRAGEHPDQVQFVHVKTASTNARNCFHQCSISCR